MKSPDRFRRVNPDRQFCDKRILYTTPAPSNPTADFFIYFIFLLFLPPGVGCEGKLYFTFLFYLAVLLSSSSSSSSSSPPPPPPPPPRVCLSVCLSLSDVYSFILFFFFCFFFLRCRRCLCTVLVPVKVTSLAPCCR